MNRIITLAGLLLIAASVTAQRVGAPPRQYVPGKAVKPEQPLHQENGAAKGGGGTVVWSEDFLNGATGNNPSGPWSTSGADGAIWLYDTDGPNGDFSDPATEHITSTTFSNGFMIFDSNLSNPGAVSTNRVGALVSPLIDLSATPFVHLVFEQRMRYCCAAEVTHWVEVSTDGGATWPNKVQVDDGIAVNADPGTQTRRVNLGALIQADPSNVMFRFNHECYNCGTGTVSHYHWQIDDINIEVSPDNDLTINYALYQDWVFETATNYDSIEYGVYPFSQLRGLNLKTLVWNNGSVDQPNTNMLVTITDPGSTEVYNVTVPAGTFPPATKDSLYATDITPFTPAATEGTFTIDWTLASDSTDENPGDNTAQRTFGVDEFDYAIDNGSRQGRDGNNQAGYQACNVFHITNDVDLTAIRVVVATGTVAGAVIKGTLLDIDQAPLDETPEHTITSTEITPLNQAKWINLVLNNPYTLAAGEEYYVCLQSYGGPDSVLYGYSGSSERTASLFYRDDVATWFYTTETPMVRMNFDPTIGIEEHDVQNGVGLGQNFPNPSNGTTTIPYSLEESASVSIALFDLSGKRVTFSNEGNQAAGAHRVHLDTTNLPEGVYFYTLSANGTNVTKRMTVIH